MHERITPAATTAAQHPRAAPPTSFAAVVNLWRSAADLAAILDVEAVTVRAWRVRGIPARHWFAVADAARRAGLPVDERLLATLGAVRKGSFHG